MLKYVNTGIVFQEIPDEVTLAIARVTVLGVIVITFGKMWVCR